MAKEALLLFIKKAIGEIVGLNPDLITEKDSFFKLGLDSFTCILVLNKIEIQYHWELNPVLFWDYPTVGELSDYLFEQYLNEGE